VTDGAPPKERQALAEETWRAARLTLVLLFASGVAFPLLLWAASRLAFPRQAEGSLVLGADGRVVGSALIAQSFTRPEYFHSRPSAAGYDAAASSGSNIGPTNPQLLSGNGSSFAGIAAYAAAYRRENGLSRAVVLPNDAVTASGSGLDPHISPANADLQVARVAAARGAGFPPATVRELVRGHTGARTLGIFGEPRVNVLLLNLALDSAGIAARGKR
jgi:K+-transporting ATPase ATPase C chain